MEDNAKNAKARRDKNPEKQKEANEQKKCNIKIHYGNYVRDAANKNIKFELTFDEFVQIVMLPCYFCGIIQDKGFNGIDKMNYDKGYIKENSISCCTMCNYMKGTLTPEIFLKRVEHILTYQGYIEGKFYPECFANHNGSGYNDYKNRANKKLKEFEITEEQFYEIIFKKCYMCGKKTDDNHTNGIDRINNDKGYTTENIVCCCGECNYMKNKFNLDDLIDKLRKIKKNKLAIFAIINSRFKCQDNLNHKKHYNKTLINDTAKKKDIIKQKNKIKMRQYREKLKITDNFVENKENEENIVVEEFDNSKIHHLNKKTPDQIKEEARLRKQIQREKLKEKYGNEEYKKKRALEIAEYRKRKNLTK